MVLGILTSVKLAHLRNASSPIVVIEFGIVTFVRLLQSSNAFPAICCIPSGIVYSVAYPFGK